MEQLKIYQVEGTVLYQSSLNGHYKREGKQQKKQ